MRSPCSVGGVEGNPGLPGSVGGHKAFLLGPSYYPKPARTPAWDSAALEPEAGGKPSSGPGSRWRATRSVSPYKGHGGVDNPTQHPP